MKRSLLCIFIWIRISIPISTCWDICIYVSNSNNVLACISATNHSRWSVGHHACHYWPQAVLGWGSFWDGLVSFFFFIQMIFVLLVRVLFYANLFLKNVCLFVLVFLTLPYISYLSNWNELWILDLISSLEKKVSQHIFQVWQYVNSVF